LRLCLEEALELLAPKAADKNLDLAFLVDQSIPNALIGDVTRLRQILVNLVGNAVKFTETGEIIVEVTPARTGLAFSSDQSFPLHFSVRDTGIGIPKDKQDRLFQSFTQVDSSTTRQYGGTGLGLVISRRLAELMGGGMSFESDAGRGATFRFSIQVKCDPRPAASVSPAGLAGQHVLIVEDHAINRQILAETLRKWDLTITAAASESEARSVLQSGRPFDVVIIDAQLPGDPLPLLERIRQSPRGQAATCLLLSSMHLRAGDTRVKQAGVSGVVSKPIREAQLREVLQRTRQGLASSRRGPLTCEIDRTLAERLPLRLLLADDNRVNQKVGAAFLEKMGYRVQVAGNGLEVLQALDRQKFDLIFLDVHMPEMDGYEAAGRIRAKWAGDDRPYVIAMTGNTMEGDREICLSAGMDDYIAKPVRAKELQGILLRWGSRKRGLDPHALTGQVPALQP
jgi:CheY-like chemotaxis protein